MSGGGGCFYTRQDCIKGSEQGKVREKKARLQMLKAGITHFTVLPKPPKLTETFFAPIFFFKNLLQNDSQEKIEGRSG